MSDDAPARPEPKVEPPEPPPGGPNAIDGVGGTGATPDARGPVLPRDLDPDLSPTSDDAGVPDDVQQELEEGEDTETQATKGEESPEPEQESPA